MSRPRRPRLAVPLSVAPSILPSEPDLSPAHKSAILEALRHAWAELLRTDLGILQRGQEEEVTYKLQELLNERSNGKRKIKCITDFDSVTRGEGQKTADGRLGKKPDLTFRPPAYKAVVNTTRWGWFVECKLINGGASIAAYRDNGVQRFSSGEYAAHMPSGGMLAYVRDGSAPAPTLKTALTGQVGTKRHAAGPTADRCLSQHDRSRLPNPCCDVALAHLWLSVPRQ